ncbi:hypothetical protein APHAL10511_005760, partial [Amanita phalloides]
MNKSLWSDFPGKELLKPSYEHPAQYLLDSCLLCPNGVVSEDGIISVWTCLQCLESLHSGKNKTPPLALVNGLWMGDIPSELQDLTIAEQKLVALIYPQMHVYKLYPKVYHGETGLQTVMQGSLSTYALNIDKISHMITGKLMPHPLAILPSVIAMLYVGKAKLPRDALKSLLHVWRVKVYVALVWLKKNNLKYFGDVEIDENMLQQLPEDDMPEELLAIVQTTNDEHIIDEEHGGYVPVTEDLFSCDNLEISQDSA